MLFCFSFTVFPCATSSFENFFYYFIPCLFFCLLLFLFFWILVSPILFISRVSFIINCVSTNLALFAHLTSFCHSPVQDAISATCTILLSMIQSVINFHVLTACIFYILGVKKSGYGQKSWEIHFTKNIRFFSCNFQITGPWLKNLEDW